MAAHSQPLPNLQRQPARQLRHTQGFSNHALLNSSRPLNRPSVRNLPAPLRLPHGATQPRRKPKLKTIGRANKARKPDGTPAPAIKAPITKRRGAIIRRGIAVGITTTAMTGVGIVRKMARYSIWGAITRPIKGFIIARYRSALCWIRCSGAIIT